MPFFRIVVPETIQKVRLDKAISDIQSGMNRSKLKTGLNDLSVNGKPAKLSAKVSSGDVIEFNWDDAIPNNIEPQNIPLDIIYEDENVTVVNKKQGMVTHPATGNWTGTLVNALLFRWGKEAINTENSVNISCLRPGIVHRLDKDTSGVIITAKNRESEEWLHLQFSNHNLLLKEYIAICVGRPKVLSGIIETNITRDTKDRKKFMAVPVNTEGKYAKTLYQCVGIYERGKETYSLFRIRIKTGRTHQIRVHLKSIGCSILGDPLYNKKSGANTIFSNATLMLHARQLNICLPNEKKWKVFKAKIPLRFRKVMFTLHKNFRKVL